MIAWLYLIQDERIPKAYRLRENISTHPSGAAASESGHSYSKCGPNRGELTRGDK